MQIAIIIGIIAAIVVIGFVLRSRRKLPPVTTSVPIPETFAFGVNTPRGTFVISNVEIPANVLTLIDNGIQAQLDSTAHLNWQYARNHGDYQVMFIDPITTNTVTAPGSPALIVYGVQSAGTCIGIGNDPFSQAFIVLPHQVATNWRFEQYLSDTVRHESEHIIEWICDRDMFWSFVGAGDVHPHFP